MKKIIGILALGVLLIACGEKKEEKKEGFQIKNTKKEVKKEVVSESVPVDMDNKGIGPFKSVTFDAIDETLAATGKAKYNTICTACHLPEKRLTGPALKGVFERRSPEWVMNMIINTSEMIKEDPIAIALLKEYNNAVMITPPLSEDETRAIAEYLRTF